MARTIYSSEGFQGFQNDIELEFTQETKYRFAEIELKQAIDTLSRLYKYAGFSKHRIVKHLLMTFIPENELTELIENDFYNSCNTFMFNNPQKDVLVHYFRYKGTSYGKITKMTGVSSATISRYRFKDNEYYPIFQHWQPLFLSNWNKVSQELNLFNENTLIHTKERKR